MYSFAVVVADETPSAASVLPVPFIALTAVYIVYRLSARLDSKYMAAHNSKIAQSTVETRLSATLMLPLITDRKE